MSAETAFIDALAAHLASAGLAPAPVLLGAAEPAALAELPAVVLSLPEVHRLGAGLGERAALVTGGALVVTARIDLANPVLPEEPLFRLLSADRRTLILPHGGWVKADGTEGPLSGADLQVSVAAAPRTVVNAAPAAGQVQPTALVGTLLFGEALPPTGTVVATYRIGQWERRSTPIAGTLRIAVHAASAATAATLSAAVADVLDATSRPLPTGLRKVALTQVSATSAVRAEDDAVMAGSRQRWLQATFEYEHIVDRPDSSGGVIQSVPIRTRLLSTTVEPASGAFITSLTSEPPP